MTTSLVDERSAIFGGAWNNQRFGNIPICNIFIAVHDEDQGFRTVIRYEK